MTFLLYLTFIVFIVICVFLILLILIQKGRGGGLASAFGGGGGNTAFGSKTGDVLTWATSIAFGVFLLTAIALNRLADARHNQSRPQPAAPLPTQTIPVGTANQNGGQAAPGGPTAPAKGGDTSLPQPVPAEPAPKPVAPAPPAPPANTQP